MADRIDSDRPHNTTETAHLPETDDALHGGIAAVTGMDLLLTWNGAHIVNAAIRGSIENVCRSHGLVPPVICTPLELLEE